MSGPCVRPECGGVVHTDPWGTSVQCPHAEPVAQADTGRRCPRCDCPDGHEQCEHCKVCPHADRSITGLLAAQLPPFSGDRTTCAKCGYVGAATTYRAQNEPRPDTGEAELRALTRTPSDAPERLERCCLRCSFVWDEALAQTEAP